MMPYHGGGYRQRGSARDRVAGVLMAATGPLATPEVAARCGLSRALVAAQLAALERAGWVERHAGAGRAPDSWSWRQQAAA